MSCTPGATQFCYSGPREVAGVGICDYGMQVCNELGTAFGACTGDVLPQAESCETPLDEDCDGEAPPCPGGTYWSVRFGDAQTQHGTGVAVGSTGEVVVIGSFQGTVDLGGGPLASAGSRDVVVAKLTPDGGNHLWSKRFGDPGLQAPSNVAVDSAGNIVVVGTFNGNLDLGGGPLTSAGEDDVFVVKLDADGNHLWSKRFGEATFDQESSGVAVDPDGNVLVAGLLKGTVDFGGGPLTSAGAFDAFVLKLDPSGNHVWSKRFGDSANDFVAHVATDPLGNVLLTGNFESTIGFGGEIFTSGGDADVFVVKLAMNGDHVWSKAAGGPLSQAGVGIAADADANVVLVGDFAAAIDFGGGALTAVGSPDSFVVKLGPGGDHLWSRSFGVSSMHASSVTLDTTGNVVVGRFTQSVDFGGGVLSSAGMFDLFVAKLDPGGDHVWSRGIGAALTEHPATVAVDVATDRILFTGAFEGTVDFGNGPLQSSGSTDGFVMKMAP